MKPIVKNSLIMSISFAIIGAGLTAIDATVAQGLGFSPELVADLGKNSPGWMGVFFGMFGGASVVIPEMVGKFFTGERQGIAHGKGKAPEQDLALEQAVPELAPGLVHDEPQPQKTAADYGVQQGMNGCPANKCSANGCPTPDNGAHTERLQQAQQAEKNTHQRG